MARIIDGRNLFQRQTNDYDLLEYRLEYYRNFLLMYEGLESHDKYYITFSEGLNSDDEFVDIFCPHCGFRLNEHTMYNVKVFAHSKRNCSGSIEDRATWGIVEVICPDCFEKTVVILEDERP